MNSERDSSRAAAADSARAGHRLAVFVCATALATAMSGCGGPKRAPRSGAAPAEETRAETAVEPPADAPPADALAESRQVALEVDGILHVVVRGQTAWRIAKAYGISLEELVDANGLADPSKLEIGQVLVIPGAAARLDVAPYPAPIPRGARPLDQRGLPRLDLLWPVEGGRVLSRFGDPRGGSRRHAGLDLGAEHGWPVLAAGDGVVLFSGTTRSGYGTAVIVDHGSGVSTLYAHNSRVLVREGQRVRRGQHIARVGSSGNASGPHCHFEIRFDDVPVDPLAVLPTTAVGGAP